VKVRIFNWDWKEQPDLNAIAKAVMEISETGPVFMREIETGGDFYIWVVADREVSDKEAEKMYRSWNP
jgi:hypothetical protein